jgi:hypothetical protein
VSVAGEPCWHLVTGEYPPGCGGVGEYTALLAAALVAAGRTVHVWAPGGAEADRAVHPVGSFHGQDLRRMDEAMDAIAGPRVILIQYAPQAFGRRGMNLAVCRWALSRSRRGDEVRVMFHEPFVRFSAVRPRRNVLAAATRVMARMLLKAASVAYVSTPAWEPLLRPLAPRRLGEMRWLPIPSTVPRVEDDDRVTAIRASLLGPTGETLVGHFGTYGGMIAPLLEPVLASMLAASEGVSLLLLGRGGPEFADRLRDAHPALGGRLRAPGELDREALSFHLQACDLVVQPYPDGVSGRRTTVMAPLANGVPVVTNAGAYTEPVWREGAVSLAPSPDPVALAEAALAMIAERQLLGHRRDESRAFYERSFAMERTVRVLLGTR